MGKNNMQIIGLFPTNCFLLRTRDGYLLIDTSYHDKYGLFIKELKKRDIKLEAIKYLLLTHHHCDHVGFAAEIVKNTGAKIIIHKNAVHHLKESQVIDPLSSKNGVKSLNLCVEILSEIYFKVKGYNFTYPPVTITEKDYVVEGDNYGILKEIGIDGIILSTPGHSDDSISIVLSDGRAFVGDTAMNFLNICHTKYRPIFVENFEKVYGSWRKIIEYGAKIIYPAHGKPFSAENLKLQLEKKGK